MERLGFVAPKSLLLLNLILGMWVMSVATLSRQENRSNLLGITALDIAVELADLIHVFPQGVSPWLNIWTHPTYFVFVIKVAEINGDFGLFRYIVEAGLPIVGP